MDQVFQIVNIDKRQTTDCLGKWGEFQDTCQVCRWIRRNKMCTLEEVLEITDLFRRKRTHSPATLGSFSKIPAEVIDTIFKAMPTMESAIFLAITNSLLFAIGYRTITQRILDADSPWMYDRIICISNYAKDLPSGYLSEDEKLSLLKDLPEEEGNLYTDENGNFSLDCLAQRSFTRMPRTSASSHTHDSVWRITQVDYGRWFYMDSARDYFCKPIRSPVLVNATKKEYIREAKGIELEVVLLQLVVWGQPEGDTHLRGPWAGDRLAIIPMDDLAARMEREDGWKDFTEEGLDYQHTYLKMFEFN